MKTFNMFLKLPWGQKMYLTTDFKILVFIGKVKKKSAKLIVRKEFYTANPRILYHLQYMNMCKPGKIMPFQIGVLIDNQLICQFKKYNTFISALNLFLSGSSPTPRYYVRFSDPKRSDWCGNQTTFI